MRLDRVARDAELLPDFPGRETRWQEPEDRRLADGELLDHDQARALCLEDEPKAALGLVEQARHDGPGVGSVDAQLSRLSHQLNRRRGGPRARGAPRRQ